jgi:hypothetical protein
MTSQQLSPRSAVGVGLVTCGLGAFVALLGLGVIPIEAPGDGVQSPPWVIVCCGLVFVLAGLLVILDYAVARAGPNGQLLPGTPWFVRVAQYLLALGVIGLMAVIPTWIAFGSGERHFSTSVSVPFYTQRGRGGETGGRVVFAASAMFMWLMFIGMGVSGAKRLLRGRNPKDG